MKSGAEALQKLYPEINGTAVEPLGSNQINLVDIAAQGSNTAVFRQAIGF